MAFLSAFPKMIDSLGFSGTFYRLKPKHELYVLKGHYEKHFSDNSAGRIYLSGR
jgi:hypothetical protein